MRATSSALVPRARYFATVDADHDHTRPRLGPRQSRAEWGQARRSGEMAEPTARPTNHGCLASFCSVARCATIAISSLLSDRATALDDLALTLARLVRTKRTDEAFL